MRFPPSRTTRRLWALLGLLAASPAGAEAPAFKISVGDAGVYHVCYDDLREAGLAAPALFGAALGLTQRGVPVPIRIDDGGDGWLGPGDGFTFAGEELRGTSAYFHEYSDVNVYVLETEAAVPLRVKPGVRGAPRVSLEEAMRMAPPYRLRRHMEDDRLLLRFASNRGVAEATPRAPEGAPEIWYWAKLSSIDPKPLRVPIGLAAVDRGSDQRVTLRVGVRGWSRPARKPQGVFDHGLELDFGPGHVRSAEWDGDGEHVITIDDVRARDLPVRGTLLLRVPARRIEPASDPLPDVVLLNWIEIDGLRSPLLGRRARVELGDAPPPLAMLHSVQAPRIQIFGDDGSAVDPADVQTIVHGARTFHVFHVPPGARTLHVVPADDPDRPVAVEPLRRMAEPARADYVMIAHPRLRGAIAPLAKLHRERGLEVFVTDTAEIYDTFNDGIAEPRAIRAFLEHAWSSWAPPRLHYVLLVGDASWDTKNVAVDEGNYARGTTEEGSPPGRFRRSLAQAYAGDATSNDRNLVPSYNYPSQQGHAASDNWYACIDGDDFYPDVAIGRLPVVEPTEVAAIVEKTIAYASGAEPGPWRARLAWITDGTPSIEKNTDAYVSRLAWRGFDATKVYPGTLAAAAERQEQIRTVLDAGQLVVHFFGHGGRFIWRTAPADYEENRDLFTLEDLEELAPTARLPFVISMTCYSAPFDHPSADSIGEKFLRLSGRGAVGVFAASWRVTPSSTLSQAVIDELLGGATIGDAILRGKRKILSRDTVELYNLLGDPAIPAALPRLAIALGGFGTAGGRLLGEAEIDAPAFRGKAEAVWLDAAGEPLHVTSLRVAGPRFRVAYDGPEEKAERVAGCRVYAWSEREGLDALGVLRFAGAEDAP